VWRHISHRLTVVHTHTHTHRTCTRSL
jgi:hypothetical protein